MKNTDKCFNNEKEIVTLFKDLEIKNYRTIFTIKNGTDLDNFWFYITNCIEQKGGKFNYKKDGELLTFQLLKYKADYTKKKIIPKNEIVKLHEISENLTTDLFDIMDKVSTND